MAVYLVVNSYRINCTNVIPLFLLDNLAIFLSQQMITLFGHLFCLAIGGSKEGGRHI